MEKTRSCEYCNAEVPAYALDSHTRKCSVRMTWDYRTGNEDSDPKRPY